MLLTKNIDEHPYTGVRNVEGKLRVKIDPYLASYFNGSPRYTQVENITMGKEYEVTKIEGLGDCEVVTIIDDIGEEHQLSDFFFEEVDKEITKEQYIKILRLVDFDFIDKNIKITDNENLTKSIQDLHNAISNFEKETGCEVYVEIE